MNLLHQQQEKDLSLLRPFDLEKAQEGEILCDSYEIFQYALLGISEYQQTLCVQLINNPRDGFYFCTKDNLRMKPLCWLEGKPVYKGDVLWNTAKGCGDYNYVVESFNGKYIYSTLEGSGSIEYLDNLSWVKREKEPKEKQPEVLHDVNKFKVGDKVKVVRVLPCGEYQDKGWDNDWIETMDDYLHNVCMVSGISEAGVYLEHPKLDSFTFPSSVLELVEQPKGTQKKVKVLEVYLDGELIKKEEIEVE